MDNLIIFLAKYLIFIMVLILLVVWLRSDHKNRWQFAALVILSGIIALALSWLASKFYYHPRPFVLENIKPLVAQETDNSFPSNHMLLASTLALVAYIYNRPAGAVMLVLALLVGLGRIGAHVHSPIDIIGSFALSAIGVWAGYQIVRRLRPANKKATSAEQDN
ncbi:TPA: hypothetical protein DIS56_03115 [Candidatus Saccharibacteria bacterium]|nr:MAG: hypothetical protein UX30_C0001G0045 [Candidatus Saccharibacteria bacterium GW2011_GWA2_46_10]OGL35514.1 MAG: hypothetical protein A3F05_00115 [Candidatus Saccharibacteria bacterium RIFCSPHIGHO2_12_FULL_47_17]HCM52092.1 hypothetical protein [Candidatus Saccharibacteria bacterium]